MQDKKRNYFFPFLGGGLLFLGLLSFGLARYTVHAQTSNNVILPNAQTLTTPDVQRPRVIVTKTASITPAISPLALSENARLRDTMNWTFGAKSQRGWYLYVSLIQQMLDTPANSDTPEFARSIADWQEKSGIAPSGILDIVTLNEMVKYWQSQRLGSSQYPAESQLLSAPIADFYDPTRSPELLKVERETYAAYKRMVAAAAKDLKLKVTATGELAPEEKFLKIVSAFRSREYQAQLRAKSPNSGRAGLATHSPHFTGQALDIYVGGEPVETKDYNRAIQVQTPAYKWLVKNAAKFGFYPYYYEPWHWEYVSRVR